MRFNALAGLGFGTGILALAIAMAGVPLQLLIRPESLLVVFGGTATALLTGYSPRTVWHAAQAFQESLSPQLKQDHPRQMIDDLAALAQFVRRQGVLALHPFIAQVEQPLLRQGLLLLMDQVPESVLREQISTEIELNYRDALEHARVFEAAGGYAPTMGLMGALIGLIQVVSHFDNPAALGQGVAAAFCATLMGLGLSNLILLPIGGKLRQRARDQWFQESLVLQGLLSLHAGEHPRLLEEKLRPFLREMEPDDDRPMVSPQDDVAPQKRQAVQEVVVFDWEDAILNDGGSFLSR
jgi:chemotaxis protein MotA